MSASESHADKMRHGAAIQAASMIDAVDEETLHQHQIVVEEAEKLGMMFARAGMAPYAVLGQMQQAVAVAFVPRIVPRYKISRVEDEDDR